MQLSNKNVNIMLTTVALDNWKSFRKFEIKIYHFVNNLFYLKNISGSETTKSQGKPASRKS